MVTMQEAHMYKQLAQSLHESGMAGSPAYTITSLTSQPLNHHTMPHAYSYNWVDWVVSIKDTALT